MMRYTNFKSYSVLPFLIATLLIPAQLFAQALTLVQIDSLVNNVMKTFDVPGISLAIVKNGTTIYCRGYGIRSVDTKEKVNENTLFGIASNSKAFTSAVLGILVNQSKLNWDDKVITYLPEFKMYDNYVTQNFTIRDLLTHRSGLAQGAGDLLHNPDSANFTIKEVIHALRYLKPVQSFRNGYAYDNILYLVASELIARVSGSNWGDFVEKNIFRPLEMSSSGATYRRIKNNPNVIDGHINADGQLKTIPHTDSENEFGAGGIYSSAADMGKWMLMQLNNGKYGKDLQNSLFSPAIHKEMWTPQTIIPVSNSGVYNTHFGAYGLGWFLIDAKGYLQVSHSGQDNGMISEVSLIPEINLGITVLSNQEGGGAVLAIIDQITDGYLGVKGQDRIQELSDRVKQQQSGADTIAGKIWKQVAFNQSKANYKPDIKRYTGTYHDNWFGNITISVKNGELWFSSERSLQLKGPLLIYQDNTYALKLANPKIHGDALVQFNFGAQGKANRITMKRLSPQTSVAFDYQDLNFNR